MLDYAQFDSIVKPVYVAGRRTVVAPRCGFGPRPPFGRGLFYCV